MMATLNGLYVSRMPVPENPREDVSTKANTDEMVGERVHSQTFIILSDLLQSDHEADLM